MLCMFSLPHNPCLEVGMGKLFSIAQQTQRRAALYEGNSPTAHGICHMPVERGRGRGREKEGKERKEREREKGAGTKSPSQSRSEGYKHRRVGGEAGR